MRRIHAALGQIALSPCTIQRMGGNGVFLIQRIHPLEIEHTQFQGRLGLQQLSFGLHDLGRQFVHIQLGQQHAGRHRIALFNEQLIDPSVGFRRHISRPDRFQVGRETECRRNVALADNRRLDGHRASGQRPGRPLFLPHQI